MKVRVPFSAPGFDPVQGASRKWTPLAASFWPIARLRLGETVLQSAITESLAAPFDQAVLAEHHLFRHRRIADAQEDRLGSFGHFLGRGTSPALAFGRQGDGLGGGIRPERHLVTGLEQMPSHRGSHDAQTEETEFCHP